MYINLNIDGNLNYLKNYSQVPLLNCFVDYVFVQVIKLNSQIKGGWGGTGALNIERKRTLGKTMQYLTTKAKSV